MNQETSQNLHEGVGDNVENTVSGTSTAWQTTMQAQNNYCAYRLPCGLCQITSRNCPRVPFGSGDVVWCSTTDVLTMKQ